MEIKETKDKWIISNENNTFEFYKIIYDTELQFKIDLKKIYYILL